MVFLYLGFKYGFSVRSPYTLYYLASFASLNSKFCLVGYIWPPEANIKEYLEARLNIRRSYNPEYKIAVNFLAQKTGIHHSSGDHDVSSEV